MGGAEAASSQSASSQGSLSRDGSPTEERSRVAEGGHRVASRAQKGSFVHKGAALRLEGVQVTCGDIQLPAMDHWDTSLLLWMCPNRRCGLGPRFQHMQRRSPDSTVDSGFSALCRMGERTRAKGSASDASSPKLTPPGRTFSVGIRDVEYT